MLFEQHRALPRDLLAGFAILTRGIELTDSWELWFELNPAVLREADIDGGSAVMKRETLSSIPGSLTITTIICPG